MRLKTLFIILLVGFGFMSSTFAQKIGYANIEAILIYMPETQSMNQQLQTFEKKLSEKIQIKQQYAQQKYNDLLEKAQANPEGQFTAEQEELKKLDEELQKESNDAQQKLLQKRQDLMSPIIEKLQKNLKELADAEGYDYILNTVDGNGVSIVLHGPEEHDLTKKLMTKMGIKIPEGQ